MIGMPKSEWGPGPWQDEPDRHEWRYRGLPCIARRNMGYGTWCGYVGVPPGHPWFGKGDVDADAHGGITYAGSCDDNPEVCHVPLPGEPDNVWWLGFDCGHGGIDVFPAMKALGITSVMSGQLGPETYKTLEYVQRQCEQLADQVLDAGT